MRCHPVLRAYRFRKTPSNMHLQFLNGRHTFVIFLGVRFLTKPNWRDKKSSVHRSLSDDQKRQLNSLGNTSSQRKDGRSCPQRWCPRCNGLKAYLSSHITKKHKIGNGSSTQTRSFPGFDSDIRSFHGSLDGEKATSDGQVDSLDQRDEELNDLREWVQTSVNNVDHQFNEKAQFSVKFLDTHQTKHQEKRLLSFYDHLKSLNGGMLNAEGTAKQHVHETGVNNNNESWCWRPRGACQKLWQGRLDQMVRTHN